MPGATPAGSWGGTGFYRCQQQAPVVGRFVFQLSLVLRLSPRTRQGCGYRFSRCFLGLGQADLEPARVGDASSHGTLCLSSRESWGPPHFLRAEGKDEGSQCSHRSLSHSTQSEAKRLLSGCQHPSASPQAQLLTDLHRRARFMLPQPCP